MKRGGAGTTRMVKAKPARGNGGRERGAGRTATRARERARDVDKLVVEIARHMLDGTWSHETKVKIASREDVKVPTVEEWSAEAGRMLRVGHDVEHYRAVNLKRLDETYGRAEDAGKAVQAIAEQNRMLGLHVPEKGPPKDPSYDKLDDAAMLARIEEQMAALAELRAEYMRKLRIVEMVPALPAGGSDVDR